MKPNISEETRAKKEREMDATPLDRSGALIFLGLVIIFITGIYLFFCYSVEYKTTYNSMASLYNDTIIGGLIRATHKHASRIVLVLVLYHVLTGIISGKFISRGPEVWLSGCALFVFLMWQGITGYILPMDERSQAIIYMLAKSLFPILGDSAETAFIVNAEVSTRSVLYVLAAHVIPPVVALVLIGLHVRRVPLRHVLPSKLPAIAFSAGILIAAMISVKKNLPRADFTQMTGKVDFDWLYMLPIPLMHIFDFYSLWLLIFMLLAIIAFVPAIMAEYFVGPDDEPAREVRAIDMCIVFALSLAILALTIDMASRAFPKSFDNQRRSRMIVQFGRDIKKIKVTVSGKRVFEENKLENGILRRVDFLSEYPFAEVSLNDMPSFEIPLAQGKVVILRKDEKSGIVEVVPDNILKSYTR